MVSWEVSVYDQFVRDTDNKSGTNFTTDFFRAMLEKAFRGYLSIDQDGWYMV